jgi:hypothetical protein
MNCSCFSGLMKSIEYSSISDHELELIEATMATTLSDCLVVENYSNQLYALKEGGKFSRSALTTVLSFDIGFACLLLCQRVFLSASFTESFVVHCEKKL